MIKNNNLIRRRIIGAGGGLCFASKSEIEDRGQWDGEKENIGALLYPVTTRC